MAKGKIYNQSFKGTGNWIVKSIVPKPKELTYNRTDVVIMT